MDVFEARNRLIDEYREFTTSFVDVRGERVAEHVRHELDAGKQWPEPWISLNSALEPGGRIDELVAHEVDYIMETFPIVNRKDEADSGDFHTERLILEVYDAMQQAMDMGVPHQTPGMTR